MTPVEGEAKKGSRRQGQDHGRPSLPMVISTGRIGKPGKPILFVALTMFTPGGRETWRVTVKTPGGKPAEKGAAESERSVMAGV